MKFIDIILFVDSILGLFIFALGFLIGHEQMNMNVIPINGFAIMLAGVFASCIPLLILMSRTKKAKE